MSNTVARCTIRDEPDLLPSFHLLPVNSFCQCNTFEERSVVYLPCVISLTLLEQVHQHPFG